MLKTVLFVCSLFLSSVAMADVAILSAPDAHADEDLILLDIRTPGEWAETGLAEGAWPVSMHEPGFGQKLQAILDAYPPERIAMICAVGGRTGHVTGVLEKNGISVLDLSEGMMGNDRGPGWIARGLPIVTAEAAHAAMAEEFPALAGK